MNEYRFNNLSPRQPEPSEQAVFLNFHMKAQPPPIFYTDQHDTNVIGDVDAFMVYLESGQAFQDWQEQLGSSARERELFFQKNRRFWQHIAYDGSPSDRPVHAMLPHE